ncbi:putative membrane protein [Desulfosporosinus acidiphilus SJ4]|uniref:Putative membrane protein n=1 Tax=Desulfosporosinus acidiphilus (strain DSM 22704 / JCM 16185 / SJ4) TaxID=646529 RepID=I4D2Y6_DESAJ|nr:phage holin family protein [Desulfosporosinus acidiphilus]AFM40160.1 putative membrane protein [Desulfosporosinus acidiphilus SJ4]
MKRPIYRIIVNTLVFMVAAQFLPIHASSPLHYLGAGIILWIVNLLIRPVLIVLTIPLNLLTLGIFTFIINTWMILLTSGLVPGFYVHGFGTALLVSLMVSLANWGIKKIGS